MTELINDHGLRIIKANTAHIDAISCVRCIGRKGSYTGILAEFQNCSGTGACNSRCGGADGRCCGLASYGRGRRAGASGGRRRTCCCRCGSVGRVVVVVVWPGRVVVVVVVMTGVLYSSTRLFP